jgi:hypothetical protein
MIFSPYARGTTIRVRISGFVTCYGKLSDGASFLLDCDNGLDYMIVVPPTIPGFQHIIEGTEVVVDGILEPPCLLNDVESIGLIRPSPFLNNNGTWAHYCEWCRDNNEFPLDGRTILKFKTLYPR